MEAQNYIGITIGPIYHTFKHLRKTREFWAASFTFSLLSKYIIDNLIANKLCSKEDFVIPDMKNLGETTDVGIYPDRIIFKADESKWKVHQTCIDAALNDLSKDIIEAIQLDKKVDLFNLLKNYFKVYSTLALVNTDENPILIVSDILNNLEQQNLIKSEESGLPYLLQFFNQVNKKDSSFLAKHTKFIKDAQGHIRIPSLMEISTKELEKKNQSKFQEIIKKELSKDEEDEFSPFQELKEFWTKSDRETNSPTKTFKTYHKYIAILCADGDKIGETIKNLTPGTESVFSQQLIEWGFNSFSELKSYHALPIFIGGDDLVCFAPINNGEKTIFNLIDNIREKFYKQPLLKDKASISFGLAIAYYKFPLIETYQKSFELLKEAKEKGGDSIAVNYLKHSGGEFNLLANFTKSQIDEDSLFHTFILKLQDLLITDESFLSSVMFKIRENEELIKLIHHDATRIWNWCQHSFEEANDKHSASAKYKYLKLVSELIAYCYVREAALQGSKGADFNAISSVYSTLRLIRFIKGFDDEK